MLSLIKNKKMSVALSIAMIMSASNAIASSSDEGFSKQCHTVVQPVRTENDTDLVICGDDLATDITVSGLLEAGVELLYKQKLKECDWNDERPGYHLVMTSETVAENVNLPIINSETGEEICDLRVDFPEPIPYEKPYWADVMPDEDMKTVDVNGFKTRYFESGEGPALILVHGGQTGGFNNSARNWQRNFPGLAKKFRVFALDRLGQGQTENLKRDADYPDYYQHDAKHLLGFIEALSLKDVTLVGHSQGGWSVTRVALDRPDLVSCLVNVGPVVVPDDGKLMLEALNFVQYVAGPVHPDTGPTLYSSRRALLLRYPTGRNVTLESGAGQLERFASPKIQEAVRGMSTMPENPEHPTLRLNPNHPIFRNLRSQAHEEIKAGGLSDVRSLVIFGEKDLQVPLGLGVQFNDMLEEAGVETTLEVVPDAGHSPQGEFVEEFNEIVANYCISQ